MRVGYAEKSNSRAGLLFFGFARACLVVVVGGFALGGGGGAFGSDLDVAGDGGWRVDGGGGDGDEEGGACVGVGASGSEGEGPVNSLRRAKSSSRDQVS